MGFRFRKSFKLLPGLRVNMGKRGMSVSAGRRGATVNIGARGVRATVGLPGTGMSYTISTQRRSHQGAVRPALQRVVWVMVAIFGLAFLVAELTSSPRHITPPASTSVTLAPHRSANDLEILRLREELRRKKE